MSDDRFVMRDAAPVASGLEKPDLQDPVSQLVALVFWAMMAGLRSSRRNQSIGEIADLIRPDAERAIRKYLDRLE